jgi:hypothetical protein
MFRLLGAAIVLSAILSLLARPACAAPDLPKEAVCAVCGPRDGEGPEPVHSSLRFRGRTFYFCGAACEAEFQQDSAKWAGLSQPAEGAEKRAAPAPRTGGSEAPS